MSFDLNTNSHEGNQFLLRNLIKAYPDQKKFVEGPDGRIWSRDDLTKYDQLISQFGQKEIRQNQKRDRSVEEIKAKRRKLQ